MEFVGRSKVISASQPKDGDALPIDSVSGPRAVTHSLFKATSRSVSKGYRYLRMSEIDSACPREWVLGHLLTSRKRERVGFGSIVAMDFGSAAHFWLQNYGRYFDVVGYWKCEACDRRRHFGTKPSTKCPYCGARPEATFYDEYMFHVTTPYRVVGKIDGLLNVEGRYRFLEIKTTNDKTISRPVPRDVSQVTGYLNFYPHTPDNKKLPVEVDTTVGYIVYFKKAFDYSNPVATFPVRRDSNIAEPVKQKARLFTQGIESGRLPPMLASCIRSAFKKGRSKNCSMRNACYHCSEYGIETLTKEVLSALRRD